jgi:energy-coupling factor transport system substrate-specific component
LYELHKARDVPGCTKIGLNSVQHDYVPKKTGRAAQSPGVILVAIASLLGLAGFLYPFILPAINQHDTSSAQQSAHAGDAPLLFALLAGCCLAAIVVSLSRQQWQQGEASKTVALLGALVALDAALRLVPSFLGASPIFLLIVLAGAVYGGSFGFQMGALTLLVSAFLTGGVGPWLPYQMLGAGWVGMTAGWLPKPDDRRVRLLMIAAFAAFWGFLFGALLNLWFWPYTSIGASGSQFAWSPELTVREAMSRYASFYVATSLVFDTFRAAGNALLVLALGGPLLAVLDRFRSRFGWEPFERITSQTEAASKSVS